MESLPNEILMNILLHMGKQDLLTFRLVNSRWNEIATELLGHKIKINLITRMEGKVFMQVVKQIAGRSIFNEVKFSLDTIPCKILEQVALLLDKSCHKLRIHFFQMTDGGTYLTNYLTPPPYVTALMILQYLPTITFLNVSATAKLHIEEEAQTQVKELQSNLPIFRFLTKIIWNSDTELLLCVLRQAPNLQLLQIGYTSWYNDRRQANNIIKLLEILESLPATATLQTELRLHYDGRHDTEELLTRMCNFPNKMSILTLNCRWYAGYATHGDRMKPLWNPIIPEFLASQSGSLHTLYIDGAKDFDLPELKYLEYLTIQSTVPDSGFNPARFPRLKDVSISSNHEVIKLFAPHIWWNVTCLHIASHNAPTVNNENILGNKILLQLGTCFPKLEKLSISPYLFLKFIKFFRHNYFPVNEFLILDTWPIDADADEIWFELTGIHDTINENDLLSGTFPATGSGSRGFGAYLRQLKIFECPIKILYALVMASRLGNLKLQKLDLGLLLEPTEYHKYWEILSKYHDIVILRQPVDDNEEYY